MQQRGATRVIVNHIDSSPRNLERRRRRRRRRDKQTTRLTTRCLLSASPSPSPSPSHTSPTEFSVQIALTRLVLESVSDSFSSADALQTLCLLPGRSNPGTERPASHGSHGYDGSPALFRLQAAELYVLITLVKSPLPRILPPSLPRSLGSALARSTVRRKDGRTDGRTDRRRPRPLTYPPTRPPIHPGDRLIDSICMQYALFHIYPNSSADNPLIC